jgi:hypothetical protein
MNGINDILSDEKFEGYLQNLNKLKEARLFVDVIEGYADELLENEHNIAMFEGQLNNMSESELSQFMNVNLEDEINYV